MATWVVSRKCFNQRFRPTRSHARQSVVFEDKRPRSGDRSYRGPLNSSPSGCPCAVVTMLAMALRKDGPPIVRGALR